MAFWMNSIGPTLDGDFGTSVVSPWSAMATMAPMEEQDSVDRIRKALEEARR